jgi:hypothetical protein
VLDEILSVRTDRTLMQDFTVRFQNQGFQLLAQQPVRLRPKDKITMEVRLDGTTHLCLGNRYLNFQPRAAQSAAISEGRVHLLTGSKARQGYKPASTHPWRRSLGASSTAA